MSIQLQQDIVNFLKKKADQPSESKKAASDNLFSSDLKEKLKEFGLEVNTGGKDSGKDQKGKTDEGKNVRQTRLKNGMKVSLKFDKAKLGGEEKKSAELVQKLNNRQDNSSGISADSKGGNKNTVLKAQPTESEKLKEESNKEVKSSREKLQVNSKPEVEKKETSGKSKLTDKAAANSAKVNSAKQNDARLNVSELKGEAGKGNKEVHNPGKGNVARMGKTDSATAYKAGAGERIKTEAKKYAINADKSTGASKAAAEKSDEAQQDKVKFKQASSANRDKSEQSTGSSLNKKETGSDKRDIGKSAESTRKENGVKMRADKSAGASKAAAEKSDEAQQGKAKFKQASSVKAEKPVQNADSSLNEKETSSDKRDIGKSAESTRKETGVKMRADKSAGASKAAAEKPDEAQQDKAKFKQASSVKAEKPVQNVDSSLKEKAEDSEKREIGKSVESTRKAAGDKLREGDTSQKRSTGDFSGKAQEKATEQTAQKSDELKKEGLVGRQQDSGVSSSRVIAKGEKIPEQQKPESGELFKSKIKEVEKEEGRGRRTPLNNDRARLSYDRQSAGSERSNDTGSVAQRAAQQTGSSASREPTMQVNTKGNTGQTFGSLEFEEVQEKGSEQKDEAKVSDPKATDRLQQPQNQFAYMRREVTGKVVEVARTFQSSSSQNQDGWQRQRIQLGNGQSLDVAIRHSGGKLNIQLGSLSNEIAKLIQTNIMDLKAHLENQLSSEVELEFEMQGEQQGAPDENTAPFPGEGLADNEENSALSDSDVESTAPRFMGTNNNEWTG